MSILTLLLASVLTTCMTQGLFALITLKNSWYSTPTRWLVAVLYAASSTGGLWFVLAGLTGGETLIPALIFAGAQALAITLVVGSGLRGIIRNGSMEQDTNERVREMQERGQHDRPEERTDRLEGHQHRSDIDARLIADTETRSQERQAERKERAEERLDEKQGRDLELSELTHDLVKGLHEVREEQGAQKDALGKEQQKVREALRDEQDTVRDTKEKREREQDS